MEVRRLTEFAIERGSQQAELVLEFRERALSNRRERMERLSLREATELQGESLLLDQAHVLAVAGEGSSGQIIAEGDSWFDYPWNDVIELLEDDYAFEVESVAHKGDTVENMAYGVGQLEELTRRLEKLLRQGRPPQALLLSGGGNDIAGDEFGMLLDHASSPGGGLNQRVLTGVIDERVRFAFTTIIAAITQICETKLTQKIPIIIHGYDYPVPDGRGFFGGWGFLPGPWLEPGFRVKGYLEMQQRSPIMRELIDRFNGMLEELAAEPEFEHVRHVDLRGTLSNEAGSYKEWWANELHPTGEGFSAVTKKLVEALP